MPARAFVRHTQMSDADQTAKTEPARNAGRITPNLETADTIAAKFSPPDPATQDHPEAKDEKPEAKAPETKPHDGKKQTFQERISELTQKRKDAEAKAEAAERERDELRERMRKLETQPQAKQEEAKPKRADFADDEQYIDALAGWKADQSIAKREAEVREARDKAETDAVVAKFRERQAKAMEEITDYKEVVGNADIQMPPHLLSAIYESKAGPQLAYYFAADPDEAIRFIRMRPATALMELADLGKDLLHAREPEVKQQKTVEVSKAPAPIKPVRDSAPIETPPKDFESYRAKRQAELASKRR